MDKILKFSQTNTIDDAKCVIELLSQAAFNKKGQVNKASVANFYNLMLENLNDQQSSANSKFYTLYVLKLLCDNNEVKLLGVLNSHQLLNQMVQFAKSVDPQSPINEKGAEIFQDQPQIGINFMRLLLELIVYLGEKFQKNKKNEPTKFRKSLTSLKNAKVVLPTQFKYLSTKSKKTETIRDSLTSSTPGNPANENSNNQEKLKNELKMVANKINGYMSFLQNWKDISNFPKQIKNYHLAFQRDKNQMMTKCQTVSSLQNEEYQLIFVGLLSFIQKESQDYAALIIQDEQHKDYDDYIQAVFSAYNTQLSAFPDIFPKRVLNQSIIKEDKFIHSDSQEQKVPQNHSHSSENKRCRQKAKHGPSQIKKKENKNYSTPPLQLKQKCSNPSPISFRQNIKSLTKLHTNRIDSIQNYAKSNGRASDFGRNAKYHNKPQKYKLTPPKYYIELPSPKRYIGQEIEKRKNQWQQFTYISNHQGHRRFKLCNFRSSYTLFKQKDIQIGFKSEPIYQIMNNQYLQYSTYCRQSSILSLQLFIKNPNQAPLKELQLLFSSDKSLLVYGSNITEKFTINSMQQIKLSFMVIVIDIPFQFPKMAISYHDNSCEHKFHQMQMKLPISLLKFTQFTSISKKQIQDFQNFCDKFIKTPLFKFSGHIQPEDLIANFPFFTEITKLDVLYQKQNEGEKDYTLATRIKFLKLYDGIVYLHLRADFTCVIRLGIQDYSTDQNENKQIHCFFEELLRILMCAFQKNDSVQ